MQCGERRASSEGVSGMRWGEDVVLELNGKLFRQEGFEDVIGKLWEGGGLCEDEWEAIEWRNK